MSRVAGRLRLRCPSPPSQNKDNRAKCSTSDEQPRDSFTLNQVKALRILHSINGSGQETTLVQVPRRPRSGGQRDAASRRSCKRAARRIQGQTALGQGVHLVQRRMLCKSVYSADAAWPGSRAALHAYRPKSSSSKTEQAYS